MSMSNQRGPGCMATAMLAMLATILLFGLAAAVLQRGDGQRTSTIERVMQPQAAIQLEAQQLEAERAQAQMAAERAERRDWMLFAGTLGLAGIGALLLFAWLIVRRPQIIEQRVTLQLPPNTPPDMIDAQWRIIDAQMDRNGYELTTTPRRQQ